MPSGTVVTRKPWHQHAANPKTVDAVRRRMPSAEVMSLLAQTFNALGDSGRATILFALCRADLCVCDLAEILDATESAVSHQLRLLRSLRLVNHRRAGRQVYYSLADDHIRTLLAQGLEHVEELV